MTVLAVRYTGRHVRQARHGAWVNKKRSRLRRPPAQLLPAAAAFTVAGFLVGGATAAIGLSPTSSPSDLPSYDPADIPPPDPNAGADVSTLRAAPAALTQSDAPDTAAVIATGACEVSYKGVGERTASGEEFDPEALTAAHKTLP